MNHSESQIKDLFNIRKTCTEMLTDRGYEIPEIQQNVSYEDFRVMFNNKNIDLTLNINAENVYNNYNMINFDDLPNEIKNIIFKNVLK